MKGKLSEGSFQNEKGLTGESQLQDQLLVYTYSANEKEPVTFSLYYDMELSFVDGIGNIFSKSEEPSETPPTSHPVLILVEAEEGNGEDKPIEMILDKDVFTLGRDHESDWMIDDPASSRKHATIERCPNGFYIEDQESRNGTLVNQVRIKRQKLTHGDKIQVGLHYFVFSAYRADEVRMAHLPSLVPDNGELSMSMEEDHPVMTIEKKAPENWGLVVISGNMAGTFFELSSGSLSLGRGETDIRVKDAQVSRHHANIAWTTEGFVLSDCNSANGVSINDRIVTTKQLLLEDVIKIGDTRFRVVCKE
jgi:pSer/pThr/pTyr-binding forkhead associated (FHA) protein